MGRLGKADRVSKPQFWARGDAGPGWCLGESYYWAYSHLLRVSASFKQHCLVSREPGRGLLGQTGCPLLSLCSFPVQAGGDPTQHPSPRAKPGWEACEMCRGEQVPASGENR